MKRVRRKNGVTSYTSRERDDDDDDASYCLAGCPTNEGGKRGEVSSITLDIRNFFKNHFVCGDFTCV